LSEKQIFKETKKVTSARKGKYGVIYLERKELKPFIGKKVTLTIRKKKRGVQTGPSGIVKNDG